MLSPTAATPGKQQLTRQERQQCRQKSRELALLDTRLKSPAELKIKIILVGNSAVGKTSLISKFQDEHSDIRTTQVTLLCDFHHSQTTLAGKSVGIRIWDTGGMERFHDSMIAQFYRNSDGVLLVFSVDDLESFQALPRWLERVRENIGRESQFDCCVVGNKADKAEDRLVSRLEAERYAYHLGFPYIETSALEVQNVHKAFNDLALAVIRRNQVTTHVLLAAAPERQQIRLFQQLSNSGGPRKGCACN